MDKQKKNDIVSELKKNTLIIGIGTFGSKAIAFILAPIYSHYLSTTEYGTMDLVSTTVALLLPIIMADIYESVFRFTSDPKEDNNYVLTNCFLVALMGASIGLLLIYPISLFYNNILIIIIAYLYMILDGFTLIFSWYERGCGKISVFAFSGIINSVCQLFFALLLIVIFKYGLNGWFLGFFLAKLATFIYLLVNVKPLKVIKKEYIDKSYQIRLLKHCIPLMPTAIMWWVMNVSDRYVICMFLGVAANGIYSVSNKIPSILNAFENIFYQAYQTTAINSLNDKNRNRFYSNIFNNYFIFMLLGYIGILLVSRPVIIYLFDSSYAEAWLYIPPLLAGAVVHAIASNLGSYYVLFYQTKGAFTTSVWGAIINIILNIALIPHFGMMAAALTTLAGYLLMFLLRWRDIKKFIIISPNYKRIFLIVLLAVIQTFLYFRANAACMIIMIIVLGFSILINKDIVFRVFKKNRD